MRLVAVAAAVAAGLVVAGGAPAGAQTYPPPPASLTVDNPAPAPGQAITVTMSGCRPDTFALFGVDLILLGSGWVGSDGVARATITIPATLPSRIPHGVGLLHRRQPAAAVPPHDHRRQNGRSAA
jgi:hypothetical protein